MVQRSIADSINMVAGSVSGNLFKEIPLSEAERDFLDIATRNMQTFAGPIINFYSTKLLEAALAKHSEALVLSAEASDRHAKSLSHATWVLAAATIVLVVVTLMLFFKP